MWTDPNINSAMGLQATSATKRKHEITFDSKDANAYTNSQPPAKTSRWSTPTTNNNNNNISNSNNYNETTTTTATATTIILGNTTSTNNNTAATNLNKNTCDESKITAATAAGQSVTVVGNNGNQVTITNCTANNNNNNNTNNNNSASSEDSIAKLEVVAAVPCEPWNTPEPVDCISKLQAVAVPSDPWGSISTRSTLATTLLSADELDDDDDDFEDDYEEEESIIPTYCPLRYHPCPPAPSGGGGGTGIGNGPGGAAGGPGGGAINPVGMQRSYSPAHSYNSRPNYYSEPFPQQNCSRTGNQHLRMGPGAGGFTPQWGGNTSPGQNGFYVPPEAAYPPPQQTIRCAENGKSYLELGCSPASFSMTNQGAVSLSASNTNGLDARHPLKRCCDGRAGTWCNTNKNCYKDVRLKIRNLSMFKLSRFRQVSEQSLYRSVLICNTLKYIDREIESEVKEMQQQQQQHHLSHLPHTSHLHHHVPLHGSHHHHHHNNSHHHHQQQQQQQQHQHQQQHPLHQQQQQNNPSADYSPVMGCARVTNLDYHQHQQQQQQQHNQFHSQQQAADNRNGDCTQQSPYMNAMSKSSPFNTQPSQQQQQPQQLSHQQHPQVQQQQQQQQQQHQHLQQQHCNDSLHPYDHYPFRESQSGRATPFPTVPSAVTATAVTSLNNSSTTTTSSDNDSGYGEDDSNRSINWSSVLSLSSQSALDPLNNNDLFTILPPATSSTSPPAAVPVPLTSATVSTSNTFTTSTSVQNTIPLSTSSSASSSSFTTSSNSTPTTFTTLSTISSSTYSTISSASAASAASSLASAAAAATWGEYGFLDMDFGLGSEFTELMPTCKLSSDDLFKSVSPVSALSASRYSSVHDNELEHPAHIMVGS